jgi:hypothetical protein
VATPPNAIVYSAGGMKVGDMMRIGVVMNAACVLVLWGCANIFGEVLFHFSEYQYMPQVMNSFQLNVSHAV